MEFEGGGSSEGRDKGDRGVGREEERRGGLLQRTHESPMAGRLSILSTVNLCTQDPHNPTQTYTESHTDTEKA